MMEGITSKLKKLRFQNPSNDALNQALTHLTLSHDFSWDILNHDFQLLEEQGLWEKSQENAELLEGLKHYLAGSSATSVSSDKSKARDISIVKAPPLTAPHPLLRSIPPNTLLPVELVDLLNDIYLLHLLATDPSKVVAPGKSLLSAMSQPHVREKQDGELPTIQEKVEEVIHKAFWDEAIDSLSSTQPSVQLPRLKYLYDDLFLALKPLFPADHTVLVILSAPLSPTSSPLLSAIPHLGGILAALKERCAPARDADIDKLLHLLDDMPLSPETPRLAKVVVQTVRSILKLSETMKSDLSQFIFGTMSEKQLEAAIGEGARLRERDLVLDVWKKEKVNTLWREWVADLMAPLSSVTFSARHKWILRLIQSVGAPTPVICCLPTKPLPSNEPESSPTESQVPSNANTLPPPLFFSSPELLHIQNYFQGLVIAAALRALLPSDPNPAASDFMSRIWTLLLVSINDEPDGSSTTLVNFADELIRARGGSLKPDEETELRAAVKRTLKLEDPVFALLQRRLLMAVAERLVAPETTVRREVPVDMRAGRERPEKRPRLDLHPSGEIQVEVEVGVEPLSVKGFQDPVLLEALRQGLKELRTVVKWTESIWADLIEGMAETGQA
ncbi:hypothetical protein EW146_g2253 [Bondarzewia mesenterica]|uniref:Uncharacterized protein n=1 Tax=Bondarzewia mesenterica TaxID=1095465 RepID=A0A4S4M1N8_9AGAM|nr:hypothetical protein EW146_g2253 [Bondarzewia mesenterica]